MGENSALAYITNLKITNLYHRFGVLELDQQVYLQPLKSHSVQMGNFGPTFSLPSAKIPEQKAHNNHQRRKIMKKVTNRCENRLAETTIFKIVRSFL